MFQPIWPTTLHLSFDHLTEICPQLLGIPWPKWRRLAAARGAAPIAAHRLFTKWKKAKKAIKKNKAIDTKELELTSDSEYDGNVLEKASEILKTQPEHLSNTINRFMSELKDMKHKLKEKE